MNAMENDTEKRFRELSERSFRQSRYIFTDFLTPAEAGICKKMQESGAFSSGCDLSGGYPGAERQVARFGSEEAFGYTESFPVTILKISPLSEKFAESLTHRDYLGALMNLGIERDRTGDILVVGKTAWCFVLDQIADFIISHLDRVRHTSVKVETCDTLPEEAGPRLTEKDLVVSSARADAVTARVWNLSREKAQQLFREEKVAADGMPFTENARDLKPGTIISVRGYGKFVFLEAGPRTRKDRLRIRVGIYC